MVPKQPLFVLIFLIICVFLLRSSHNNTRSFTRRLQEYELDDLTSEDFAKQVAEKLCGSYEFVPPTEERQQEAYDIFEEISGYRSQSTFKDLINKGEIGQDLTDLT